MSEASSSTLAKPYIFDDFALFSKKRKEDDVSEEHIAKKKKTDERDEDFDMTDK